MKYTKVAILFCCIILVGSVLSGCVSQEAKEVINDINALGEITLDSLRDLQAINEKYAALTEEDKSSVSNVDVLEAANQRYSELKCADLNTRISGACQGVSSESLDILERLLSEYEDLSEDEKERISNYATLVDAIAEAYALWTEEITNEIISYANGSMDLAQSLLAENYEKMSDDQILECLIEIGRWDAVSEAETYLKEYLKNPWSYICYAAKCGTPKLQSDGTYKTYVYLDYGADNSFGGTVRDEVEIDVYFTIDTDSLNVEYSKTEIRNFYIWMYG